MTERLRVGIACSTQAWNAYITPDQLERLKLFADVTFGNFNVPSPPWGVPTYDPDSERLLGEFVGGLDILILCHGAPVVSSAVIEMGKNLRVIGELEGDRFGKRVDIAAARAADIMVIDTTHSSSWPVAEWALALILLGLRQQGRFRDIIAGQEMSHDDYRTNPPARELTGRTVGIVGFGHIAWRLREFLTPFRVKVLAYDPFAPRELASALNVDFASLDTVMGSEIVVCLAPATPATRGMIGARELALLQTDAVFVNVARGVVVDRTALETKAALGDAWFGLDAHDPEPIAVNTPLRGMRNVFLSPHIGGLTVEAQPRFFALMVDEIERFRAGTEPRGQLTDRVIMGRGGQV